MVGRVKEQTEVGLLITSNMENNEPQLMLHSTENDSLEIVQVLPDLKLSKIGFPFVRDKIHILQKLSNLVIYVTDELRHTVMFHHLPTNRRISFKCYDQNVTGIKTCEKYIVIVLRKKISIFHVEDDEQTVSFYHELYTSDTDDLKSNAVSLSAAEGSLLLAFPITPNKLPQTYIYMYELDAKTDFIFPAHNSQIACTKLTPCGKLIATASINGHVVKVFETESGEEVYKFRRGLRRGNITSIHFSRDSNWMACSGNETIHVYTIQQSKQEKKKGFFAIGASALSVAADYAFATVHMPDNTMKDVKLHGFISLDKNELGLITSQDESSMKLYHIDSESGDECRLLFDHSFH